MRKNRIIVMLLIMSMMLFSLAACGGGNSQDENADEPASTEIEDPGEQADDTEDSDSDNDADEDAGDDAGDGVLSPEFKQTMDDYEAWFDHYCEVMKKYSENPSDVELLTEMTDLLAEESTMLEEMETMDQSEMNAAELAYYLEVTARIEKKLLEVADY